MLSKWFLFGLTGLVLAALRPTAQAQTNPPAAPPIRADAIQQLRPIWQLDFADLPPAAGRVDSGWFAVSADGEQFALLNRDNRLILWDRTDGYQATAQADCGQPGGFIDGVFSPDRRWFGAIYVAGLTSYAAFYRLDDPKLAVTACGLDGLPSRLWFDADSRAWLEMLPNDPRQAAYVMRLTAAFQPTVDDRIPSGPESDAESFFRIGRVEPPLAVTATQAGIVKLWDLESGQITAQAQLPILPGVGQVNASGDQFAWMDTDYRELNVLDFHTGRSRSMTALNGKLIPFLLPTASADVIIGVTVGDAARILAWDTTSGQAFDLGSYRSCSRPADLARLSRDSSTLVIGCDQGLQAWRIVEGSP